MQSETSDLISYRPPRSLWTLLPPSSSGIPLSILHVDFTLRLIIKSIWPPLPPPPSLGSVLSAARDPLLENRRRGPREEFLLFIASILGAARERLKIATTTDGIQFRRPQRNRPPINLQNKTFYETPVVPVFLFLWQWPASQTAPFDCEKEGPR